MKVRTADVSGIAMHWLEEGFPVVLIHGIPTGSRLWRHVIPKLEGTGLGAGRLR